MPPTKPRRWKRWLIAFSVLLLVVLIGAALLFPYFLKRYIENNSEAWIQRKITIGSIVLNPLTGVYAVNDLVCYEPQSEQRFVAWRKVGVEAWVITGLRTGEWRFRNAELRDPYVHVVQVGDHFNFSDLLELGADDTDEAVDTTRSSVVFAVEGLEISGGQVDYGSDLLRAPISITGLEATCTRITSESARMDFELGFDLASGGRMDGGFAIDTELAAYEVDAHLRQFELSALLPYVQEFMQCERLDGTVDLDLLVDDSYEDTTRLALSAALGIHKLAMTDPSGDALFALHQCRAELDTLISREHRFELGKVIVDGADLRFVMLADGTDNWTRLFQLDTVTVSGDSTSTSFAVSESNVFVMLADYVSYLGSQFIASEYTADSLALVNSSLLFEDHTPALPFRYRVSDMRLTSRSVDTDQDAGTIHASAALNGTGELTGSAVFDPKDLRNVRVDLNVQGLQLNHLDPYGRWYAAHPLEDGVLRYETTTVLDQGLIDSKNILRVDDLKVGKRVDEHDPEVFVLPLRLAASLLKDVNGVVELEVPVKGDLKDPQFKVWPIVWQVFKNLIVKAATAPGRLLVRAFEGVDEEDLERVRFSHLQAGPDNTQRRTLKQLASVIKGRPELTVSLVPLVDPRAEQEQLALFRAKQQYLFPGAGAIQAADSAAVLALSVKDSLFVKHVSDATPSLATKPIGERCLSLVGAATVLQGWNEIEYARREHVMQLLLAEGVPPAQVAYREGTPEELAGQRGVPGFRFIYSTADQPPVQRKSPSIR